MRLLGGYKMAVAGLTVGLALGSGVLILKHVLVNLIVSSLTDEVKAACECDLRFDSIDLSLLSVSGVLTNARIVEREATKLSFAKITAQGSLKSIRDKTIILSKIDLFDGQASGLSPDSVLYRFIDQLTAPIPPERDRPGRWRVKLKELELHPSVLVEPTGNGEIVARDSVLTVKNDGGVFKLTPSIGSLEIRLGDANDENRFEEIRLGKATGLVRLEELETRFDSLRLVSNDNLLAGDASASLGEVNHLTGLAQFHFGLDYLYAPDWMIGRIVGQGSFGGTLGSPRLTGSFTGAPAHPPAITAPWYVWQPLTTIRGEATADLNHGQPIVEIRGLRAEGAGISVSGEDTVLSISADEVRGKLRLVSDSVSYGPVRAQGVGLSIDLQGKPSHVVTSLVGSAQGLSLGALQLGDGELRIQVKEGDVTLQATTDAGVTLHSLLRPQTEKPADILSTRLVLNRFPITDGSFTGPQVSGEFDVGGVLSQTGLRAVGNLEMIPFPQLPEIRMLGTARIEDGKLNVEAQSLDRSVVSRASFSLLPSLSSSLEIKAKGLPLQTFSAGIKCGAVSAESTVTFPGFSFLEAQGAVTLEDLNLGCGEYGLRLSRPHKAKVSELSLDLTDIQFQGARTDIRTSGKIAIASGFDATAKGVVDLSSLLGVLPAMDNLQGQFSADLRVKGPLSAPKVEGTGRLTGGEFALDTPDVVAHNVTADLLWTEGRVNISSVSGELNRGKIRATGIFDPFNAIKSAGSIEFQEVEITPSDDVSFILSGRLNGEFANDGRPKISGEITIDEGDLKKDLNPNRLLVQALSGMFFRDRRTTGRGMSDAPDVDLELALNASRNIFVNTTFFGAELNSALRVQGTLRTPQISGRMEVLRGWIGIRGNRFEVNSGQVTFDPQSGQPLIELSAEGAVRSGLGENVLIFVDANGPLTAPRVTLSSDRPISNDELLLLITANRNLYGRTLINSVERDFTELPEGVISTGPFAGIEKLFRNITQIDTLTFEPRFNPFSGAVEPAVVAKKRLTEQMAVFGESTFGTVTNSQAGLVYSLGDRLDLLGTAQAISTRRNTALGVDLRYTIFADQDAFMKITFEGHEALEQATLLQAARISESSRLKPEGLEQIEKSLTEFYVDQGYRFAAIKARCSVEGEWCRKLEINIDEGAQVRILNLTYLSAQLQRALGTKMPEIEVLGRIATESLRQSVEADLLRALRSEGFVSARVFARYSPSSEQSRNGVSLEIDADVRQPITFLFSGNSVFSSSNFLDAIDLFRRKRPFGNNTITILKQKIEEMYHEAGYVNATVTSTSEENASGRMVHRVTIVERQQSTVDGVRFEGLKSLTADDLRARIKELQLGDPELILNPRSALPQQLTANAGILKEVLVEAGFPDAAVEFRSEREGTDRLRIVYAVNEGYQVLVAGVNVRDLPESVVLPPLPTRPASIPEVNRLSNELLENLRNAGYLYPTLTVDVDSDSGAASIAVIPGERTTISAVVIEGASRVPQETIESHLHIKDGDAWNHNNLAETRRNLLRLGLFSRVDIVPRDGKLDSSQEVMVLRVQERALRTLEAGAGLNSEFGLHLFGEAVDRSWFLDGRSVALRLDSYWDQSSVSSDSGRAVDISQGFASARYLDPRILDGEFTFSEELRLERQDLTTQEFDLDRFSISTSFLRPSVDGLTASIGHKLLFDQLDQVSRGAILSENDTGSVRLSFLSASLGFDRRDDPLLPRSGYTFYLDPKIASRAIGSEAEFSAILGRTTAIVPLPFGSPRFTFGASLSAGVMDSFGDTTDVPITQRFYLGGRSSIRGYRENSLGPRAADGSVIGGDAMIAIKNQLNYLVADSISAHLFLDGGNVFLRDRNPDYSSLRWGTGVGVRYLSPIGPIGLDVGAPVRERSGEPSLRVHFSVGSPF
jgi:outer membrane protein insertion porin family